MIYVTGDTHGEFGRLSELDSVLKAGDTVIVCGDWGYIFRNDKREEKRLDDIEARPWTMLFVDGNHENFTKLYSYPEEIWNGGKVHRIRKNILHLCRGQVFSIEGKTFFTFGGGYSIDKEMRRPGISWWAREMPREDEYLEGEKNLKKVGFKVDYIITHTLPVKTLDELGYAHGLEERELNEYLENVVKKTEFFHWYAGHFHKNIDMERNISILSSDILRII